MTDTETYLPTKDDIAEFRAWLKEFPYLDNDVEDSTISAYFQGAKGRIEKAKSTYEGMHNIRVNYPELYSNIDPLDPLILKIKSFGYLTISPKLTDDGCLIWYCAVTDPDAFFDIPAYYRQIQIYLLRLIQDPNFPVKFGDKFNGRVMAVVNAKNYRMRHFPHSLHYMKGVIALVTSAIPLRLAAIHVVNVSPIAETFLNVFKKLTIKKLADRIFMYSDESVIKTIVSPECLIKDYGGELPSGHELKDAILEGNLAYRENILQWESKMQELEKHRPKKENLSTRLFRIIGL